MPFTSHPAAESTLARFTNDRQDAVLQEIQVLSNPDGDFTLRVIAGSPAAREEILQALGAYPYYQLHEDLGVEVKSADKRLFLNFLLHLIRSNLTDLGSILLPIRVSLGISRDHLPYRQIPAWVARGNLRPREGIRSCIYQLTQPGSSLKELELKIYPDGRSSGHLRFDTPESLLRAATILGFTREQLGTNLEKCLNLGPTSNITQLRMLIISLSVNKLVETEVTTRLGRELDEAFQGPVNFLANTGVGSFLARRFAAVHQSSDYFRSTVNRPLVPHLILEIPHLNQAILDGYVVKPEISEDFLCRISLVIMDKPVFIQGMPERFNEADLRQWIQQTPAHPYTHAPITFEDIVHDTALQAQIDSFMEEAKEQNLQQSRLEGEGAPPRRRQRRD